MPDQRNARPVSGEIMATTSTEAAKARPGPSFDFVDAEFESLDGGVGTGVAPRRYPADSQHEPAFTPNISVLRKHKAARPAFGPARAGLLFWIAGIGAAALAFWVSGGHALMRHALSSPEAPFLEPLRIAGLTSRVEYAGRHAMPRVDRQVMKDGRDTVPMPPLKIDVTAGDGATRRYNLGTSGGPIALGRKFAFASRLPVPTNGVKSVSVTFGN